MHAMDFGSNSQFAIKEELNHLDHDLIEMASRAEVMLGQAVEAFASLDSNLAESVQEADDTIDELDMDIEIRALRLLSSERPAGVDYRWIGMAIKMITDIERIADLACEIARCAIHIERDLGPSDIVDLTKIALQARIMFRESIEAYVKQDMSLVNSVGARENEVDVMCKEMRTQIHEYLRTHQEQVAAACWTLEALNHVERIADHAHNIAERVAFVGKGNSEPTV